MPAPLVAAKAAAEGAAGLLPYIEGVYIFKNPQLKRAFPAGIHFRAGLGSAFLLALVTLAAVDALGIKDGIATLLGLRADVKALDLFPLYDILSDWAGGDGGGPVKQAAAAIWDAHTKLPGSD